MKDIDESIRGFSTYLSLAWPIVQEFAARATEENFVKDWQQASWESLVEASLPIGVLNLYNGGAEFYPDSCRVFRPATSDAPTDIVVCMPAESERVVDLLTDSLVQFPATGFPMEALVAASGRTFAEAPPFRHVLAIDGDQEYVFSIDAVRFFVRSIADDER